MLNLNTASEQSTGSSLIPPKSKVLVILNIEAPASDRVGSYPELNRSQNSCLEYLNTTLEVIAGQYKGKQIFHNFNVHGASTEKEQKAVDISMAQLRALVEAHNHISPKDNSPQAQKMRMLSSFSELNGKIFPIEVKCREKTSQKSSDTLIVNELKSVVTMEDADYALLMNGGEVISDEPVPQASRQDAPQQAGKPSWGNSANTAQPNSQGAIQNNAPAWAMAKPAAQPPQQTFRPNSTAQYAGATPPPPPAYPSEQQTDDAPF